MSPAFSRRFFLGQRPVRLRAPRPCGMAGPALRIVVPSAAGGSPHIVSRLVANELAKRLGEAVVFDNRPGAAGKLACRP